MKIDILSKKSVEELIQKRFDIEFSRISSYLEKLNKRIMKIEDELIYKRTKKERKVGVKRK